MLTVVRRVAALIIALKDGVPFAPICDGDLAK